ncbi:peptidylprolyl isomerase [Candidatus Woesearchaeota archaeon]|nr:peptidylprolyl isomerase [Candidatus Woesearchaeota archaeon]
MKVEKGKTIKVHYTGTLEDGKVFDTSEGKDPLEFTVGEGKIIKGFDEGVIGMDVNEEKEITLKPEEAYGERQEKLVQQVPKQAFGENTDKLKPGVVLGLKDPQGHVLNAMVKDVGEEKVTLDMNHPLAGKTLKFKIKVVEVK